MFISIYIKTKNFNSFIKFLLFFNKLCSYDKFKTLFFIKQFNKKKKLKTFIILKSPHVNKKSGEKFEYYFYCKQLYLYSFTNKKLLILLKNKISALFPDIIFNISFLLNCKKVNKLKKYLLSPNNFLLRTYTNIQYLKLFDVFGEKCFFIKNL
jgi:hypothetical protein